MKTIIALGCAAIGLAVLPDAKAEAREVSSLPQIAHVNATVVVRHRRHRHGHYVYRHHHRVWVRY